MKALGMIRKLDDLGRVVLPKELRSTRGWTEETMLEIFVDGNKIILQEYQPHQKMNAVEQIKNNIGDDASDELKEAMNMIESYMKQ